MARRKHTCRGCSESIKKSESSIKCFGTCDRWFHRKCSHLTNQEFSEYEKGLTKEKWRCRSCADRDQDEETEDVSMKLEFVKGGSNDEPNLGAVMVLLKQMNTKFEKFEESLIFNGDLLSELQSDIKGIKMENKELKRDNVRLQARLAELEREMSRMRNTINKEECLVKRNNVVIVGLENNSIQESTREVIKICEKLELLVQEDQFDCKILSGRNGKTQLLVKFKNMTLRIK
ncbi:hypothetical protein WA026_019438 [Henosepilachna vigintioctopunctata]|uniref:PHD-type domain-containing protein n=1 Tax=Henosepilachna vigintioctopunctata TaxID=420089 RepID=A0AAW1UAX6_9CUCU